MPDSPPFDLATLDHWQGARSGMRKAEVLEAMQQRGIETTPYGDAQDLPKRFAGPLTEAQRLLSKRPDLESHLRAKRMERDKIEDRKAPFSGLHKG